MKRFTLVVVIAASSLGYLGAQGQGRHPFIDHSDTGETVHVLPPPAAIRSPHDSNPTFAPVQPGFSVFAPSYGSGDLLNHGGPQLANAGFFAIYWNTTVANAGGSGVTSQGFVTLQAQISMFSELFADNVPYSQGDSGADYTIVQQYGTRNAISPELTTLGYYVDNKSTQPSITDSKVRSYIAGLFQRGAVPVSANVIYGVYFPAGMKVTLQGGSSCSSFCGYHGHFSYNGVDVKYASFPYTNCSACKLSSLSVVDMLTIVTSHEIREAVTDPDLNAWYDSAGYEADDKCAWHNLYQMANGGFWVQPEFSNGGIVKDASGFEATYPALPAGGGACVAAR